MATFVTLPTETLEQILADLDYDYRSLNLNIAPVCRRFKAIIALTTAPRLAHTLRINKQNPLRWKYELECGSIHPCIPLLMLDLGIMRLRPLELSDVMVRSPKTKEHTPITSTPKVLKENAFSNATPVVGMTYTGRPDLMGRYDGGESPCTIIKGSDRDGSTVEDIVVAMLCRLSSDGVVCHHGSRPGWFLDVRDCKENHFDRLYCRYFDFGPPKWQSYRHEWRQSEITKEEWDRESLVIWKQ